MELFKEMDDRSLGEIQNMLNEWWSVEHVPAEYLQARVVLIYKERDISKFGN